MSRSLRPDVRNPVLVLPALAELRALSPSAQHAVKAILRDLAADARARAQKAWRSNKAPMAAYWKVVAVYATHVIRALRLPNVRADTFPPPPHGWICFHCGETFRTTGAAADHFGATPEATPGCLIKVQLGDERGLQMALRKVEFERDELKVRIAALRLGGDEQECVERFRAARRRAGGLGHGEQPRRSRRALSLRRVVSGDRK